MWCECGVHVVCMWCACGVHVVCMWCACGVQVTNVVVVVVVVVVDDLLGNYWIFPSIVPSIVSLNSLLSLWYPSVTMSCCTAHELHHNDAALDSDYDTDIYARLGHTLPRPSLPQDLVLTDENFEKRIMNFEKTAVLFYVYCEYHTCDVM